MKDNEVRFYVSRSKNGYSCLRESGGGYTNTGEAVIIADKDGKRKNAIYIYRSGHLACRDHAVIPIIAGDYVIRADRSHRKISIMIYQIEKIFYDECICKVIMSIYDEDYQNLFNDDCVALYFSNIEKLWLAIKAAINKTLIYHCRQPVYINNYEGDLKWKN